MTRKLQAIVARLGRNPSHEAHVHFHQGPDGRPAPCFDEGCPNPRLPL